MRILVTGSSGHLGEALVRVLAPGHDVVGLDLLPALPTDVPLTQVTGSIADRAVVRAAMQGVDAVLHTATLHKPHVATHARADFVATNVTGTLNLLEQAVVAGVTAFVLTSTTSAFGRALTPAPGAPAAWIDEDVTPVVRNIYGATKTAAEDLCELVHRDTGLPCVVLQDEVRGAYDLANAQVNELLHRRVDLEDVVGAHRAALAAAPRLGFGRYVVSATTPFRRSDLTELRVDAPAVVRRAYPGYEQVYDRLGWRMFPTIDRVYVNERARRELGWVPRHDFALALERLAAGEQPRSALAAAVGAKGYHPTTTGPYTRRGPVR